LRIFIISDSHGSKESIKYIFDEMIFDYLIFLGDGVGDICPYANKKNVFVVSGNCDFFSKYPNELLFEIEGKRFFITHGNVYGVKYTLNPLIEKGVTEGVNFVMFGHTHNKFIENINGIYYINPGSFKKNICNESCGLILEIEDNNVKITDLTISLDKINKI